MLAHARQGHSRPACRGQQARRHSGQKRRPAPHPSHREWDRLISGLEAFPQLAEIARQQRAHGKTYHSVANGVLSCLRAQVINDGFEVATANGWRLDYHEINALVADARRLIPNMPARSPRSPNCRRERERLERSFQVLNF